MDILRPGQRGDLDRWRGRPFAEGSEAPDACSRAYEYTTDVAREPPGAPVEGGIHRRLAAIVLAYGFFPPSVGTPVVERAPVEVGDVVGLRYALPAGAGLFFASRVTETLDRELDGFWRTGFNYRTLAGHPELGQEMFAVEKELTTGRVSFAMRSFSRPGHWLTKLGAPVARLAQRRANEAALRYMRDQAEAR